MLYAVKNKDGQIQAHAISSLSALNAWTNAMFVEWMTTDKIDVDDIPGSVARYIKEAEAKGFSVVPVEIHEVGHGAKGNTQ